MFPLSLGLWIRHAAPGWARLADRPVGRLANTLFLAVVGAIVATQCGMLAAIRPRAWLGMGLLLMASLGLGWSCGGPGIVSRKALATTTATRNVAVGLVIATSNFWARRPSPPSSPTGWSPSWARWEAALLLGRF